MVRSRLLRPLGWLLTISSGLALPAGIGAAQQREGELSSSKVFERNIQPFLKKHCCGCHGGARPEAGLRLDAFSDAASAEMQRDLWQRVLRMLGSGQMPPEEKPRPPKPDIEVVARWIESVLDANRPGPAPQTADPGRVTLRRLNRAEYANTIRDLLGVRFEAIAELPADDVGYGFDNIGDVLSLPPVLMEKYVAAAERIVRQAAQAPESRRRIFIAVPDGKEFPAEAVRRILKRFASRAYRRPIPDDELDRLVRLVRRATQEGDRFDESVQLALQAVLVSPHFLFRMEIDPLDSPQPVRLLNEYELATRMSYFLWSSMPDEDLFGQAARGVLRRNLESQALRMLRDPKSRALVENFAGQWLQLRNLANFRPDKVQFPGFDEDLRQAMRTETEMFFTFIMSEDRSLLELIDGDYTFVNERLARHYGIPNVRGKEFRRVALSGTPRGGVLTQASVLCVTSNPTRTSPVKRGKWILENILGEPPPNPPPNVPALREDKEAVLSGSVRRRLEQHRADRNCAVCHAKMDSLGFAMENFDPVGAWRTRDGTFAIDASGMLPEGKSFDGPAELRAILRTDGKEKFLRCLTAKMLTYALGRGLEPYDQRTMDKIAKTVSQRQYKFSALVVEIIKSDPFQKRRVPGRTP
ncbi:MAG: DUF1592 domain-containing protein [Thermoguttaceae bacterium]